MLSKKPELLAPAGDLTKLKTAIDYGADAVYIGGKAFSLRTASDNFSREEMEEGVRYAHAKGKKCYAALNIIAHNDDLKELESYLKELQDCGIDAVIVADMGIFDIVRKKASSLPVHISTQASNTNYASVSFFKELGAKRIVLARELSFREIHEITQKVPDVEIEAFVHGAMCVSYSGRCLLSNYMAGRDSNKGDCAQPCRWKYSLVEEKRPGEYMPVYEDDRGTFLFNSKDLCMIEYIGELVKAGVTSFKIEGRVKSEYYVATVVKAYRDAIDEYFEGKPFDPRHIEELRKISHRQYTSGFYFDKPKDTAQVYATSSYIRDYELIGTSIAYDDEKKELTLEQRNRFFLGDEVEILMPGEPFYCMKITDMKNEWNETIEVAPHPQMKVKIPCDKKIYPGSFIRKKKPLV